MRNILLLLITLLMCVAIASSQLPKNVQANVNGVQNVFMFGAKGDGTTNAVPSLRKAIDSVKSTGGTILFPAATGTYRISDTITIPAKVNLKIERGAVLEIDANKTVTLYGTLDAEPYKIFTGSGTVDIHYASIREVYAEWWGAKADSITNSGSAIQSAINAYRHIKLNGGKYRTTSAFNLTNLTDEGAIIEGDGKFKTYIIFDNSALSDPDTTIFSLATQTNKVVFRNLNIGYNTQPASTDTSVAFRTYNSAGAGLCRFQDIRLEKVWGFTNFDTSLAVNNFWNMSIDNVEVTSFSGWGMMIGGGGTSGNLFNNLYLNNSDLKRSIGGVYYSNYSGVDVAVFNQLNIEHDTLTSGYAVYIPDWSHIAFNGVHFEDLTFESAVSAFMYQGGRYGAMDISSAIVDNCRGTSGVSTRLAMIEVNGQEAKLSLRNFTVRTTNTFTAITGHLDGLYVGSTVDKAQGAMIDIFGLQNDNTTAFTNLIEYQSASDAEIVSRANLVSMRNSLGNIDSLFTVGSDSADGSIRIKSKKYNSSSTATQLLIQAQTGSKGGANMYLWKDSTDGNELSTFYWGSLGKNKYALSLQSNNDLLLRRYDYDGTTVHSVMRFGSANGAITEDSVTTGKETFSDTLSADTVTISGAASTDIYIVTLTGATINQDDEPSVEATSTGFILHRYSGSTGTPNKGYVWLRRKTP